MQCYKVKKEFIDSEKRHQTAAVSTILALIITFMIVMALVTTDWNKEKDALWGTVFAVLLVVVLGIAMQRYALKKTEIYWKGYSLIFFDDRLEKHLQIEGAGNRAKFNSYFGNETIKLKNIDYVEEDCNGLTIKSRESFLKSIFIPKLTEGYSDIKEILQRYADIQV